MTIFFQPGFGGFFLLIFYLFHYNIFTWFWSQFSHSLRRRCGHCRHHCYRHLAGFVQTRTRHWHCHLYLFPLLLFQRSRPGKANLSLYILRHLSPYLLINVVWIYLRKVLLYSVPRDPRFTFCLIARYL